MKKPWFYEPVQWAGGSTERTRWPPVLRTVSGLCGSRGAEKAEAPPLKVTSLTLPHAGVARRNCHGKTLLDDDPAAPGFTFQAPRLHQQRQTPVPARGRDAEQCRQAGRAGRLTASQGLHQLLVARPHTRSARGARRRPFSRRGGPGPRRRATDLADDPTALVRPCDDQRPRTREGADHHSPVHVGSPFSQSHLGDMKASFGCWSR